MTSTSAPRAKSACTADARPARPLQGGPFPVPFPPSNAPAGANWHNVPVAARSAGPTRGAKGHDLDRLTARQLYDGVHERMALRWVSGMRGESRVLEQAATTTRRPSLIGYLNVIYPNKIQIIGTEELN